MERVWENTKKILSIAIYFMCGKDIIIIICFTSQRIRNHQREIISLRLNFIMKGIKNFSEIDAPKFIEIMIFKNIILFQSTFEK